MKHRVFVPGRVCMLGEHSDWAGSYRDAEHPAILPGICLAYCTDVGIDLEGHIVTPAELLQQRQEAAAAKKKNREEQQQQQQQTDFVAEVKESDDDDGIPHSPTGIVLQYSFPKKTGKGDDESVEIIKRSVPFSVETLSEHAAKSDFFAHVCGTSAEMLHRFGDSLLQGVKHHSQQKKREHNGNGQEQAAAAATEVPVSPNTPMLIRINCVSMSLPMRKGLSSSAAIGVGLARLYGAISGVSPELIQLQQHPRQQEATEQQQQQHPQQQEKKGKLGPEHEMDIAFRGELRTGSQCGRLDQVVAHGPGAFVKMYFDGQQLPKCEPVVVQVPWHFVVCDLNAQKDTKLILRDLNSAYPVPKDDVDRGVHSALGEDNHRMIAAAEDALKNGDPVALGAVFAAAQKVFDTKIASKCRKELTAPRLHQVLEDNRVRAACCGGKGVGSQGDGSAQFVCKDSTQQEDLCKVLLELGCTPMKFILQPASSQQQQQQK